ncbi:zinc-binding alcohol dehydrogenase family protein [Asticcacaulis sp. SL142]|jgi:2-desacetyl-2-hydroxyethyl bacteriochlorophyllide A dehydrogenase|uniref:zinc-binding alcohol dehydrogenase family protein n=1 Tax=Asticcacaulis sp. SL142 TaxID=2995155 RepID=UPI00226CE54C|nr:zinc-binding alcohol dehydrogenase family protein [Asticcacaulis sp. SL142]WAC49445.1 zinc-binding alcohol dehydrogenase family protein [Asticcacaulis sp. SL142]
MKTVICEAPQSLGVGERSKPQHSEGQVLIRIRRVGLCGTDYHIFAGDQPFLAYPRVMGHELAGTVAATDPDSPFREGDLVTVNPYLPCGRCIACRKGKPNCCVDIQVLGVHIDGGMTEYLSVPKDAVISVSDLTLDQAAMVEFLAIGAHAVRRGDTQIGDRALIVGAGPIGVATALFVAMSGAEVTLTDTSEERLNHARNKVGIPHTAVVDDRLEDYFRQRTHGEFFDVVFDCTGSAKAIEKGFGYVAHGGRYVLVSVVKNDISFSDPEFHKREMQLIGSRNATNEDFLRVINAISEGLIPTDALKTHSFALFDLPQVIPDLIANQGSVLKAIAEL